MIPINYSFSCYGRYGVLIVIMSIAMPGIAQSMALAGSPTDPVQKQQEHKTSLLEILSTLEETLNITFDYDNAMISDKEILSKEIEKYPADVERYLNRLLSGCKLQVKKFDDNTYLIYPKNEKLKPLSPFRQKESSAMPEKLEKTIRGTVVDMESGEPMPGVSVMAKGTTTGTVTNMEGKYQLSIPDNMDVLVFSFVGFLTKEVVIGNRNVIDISLVPDIISLSEIVVVGYGTQKKSDLTGSVASVSNEAFESQSINSLEQGLQGRVPGLKVTQGSSAPGGGISIRIRGGNSILGGSEPLYVIDGLPIASNQFEPGGASGNLASNPLAAIDPSNIESIEILKDASATAIYGSRGANGVVLITTKRGKEGKATLTFDASVGIQNIAKKLELMDAQELYEFQRAWAEKQNVDFDAPVPAVDTDWQDIVFSSAITQNYNLSASGGTDKVKYAISGGYLNQDGIIETSGFNRFSFRTNIDVAANGFLKLGGNLMASRSTWDQTSSEGGLYEGAGIVSTALQVFPTVPVYNSDGSYARQTQPEFNYPSGARLVDNPVALLNENTDQTVGTRILANTYLNFKILEGLSFKVSVGADLDNRSRDVFLGIKTLRGASSNGRASVSTVERNTWLNENIFTYDKTFDEHHLNIVGGFTVQNDVERIRNIRASGFSTEITKTNDLSAGTILQRPSSNKIESSLLSYLGRINYSYKGKYLLSLTARRDGSSRFSANNKWALFPAIAAGWRLSDENFLKNSNFIDNLKIRGSWGITGNQELGIYRSLARLSVSNYNFNGNVVPGYRLTNVPNPDLKWETTKQINIGVDMGIMQGRFNLTADIYKKTTDDLLLNINLPSTSGFGSSTQNAGSLENKGLELAIDGHILTKGKLKWNAGFNISANRNKVLELIDDNDIFFNTTELSNNILIREGEAVGVFYGYKTDGIYNSQQEVDQGPEDTGKDLGMIKIVDVNSDGIANTEDLTVIGNPHPDYIFGFTSQLSFNNFSLDFLIQGSQGADIWNINNQELTSSQAKTNKLQSRMDFWSPSNTDAKFPTPGDSRSLNNSDFSVVEDGSYVRLRKVTLNYTLPKGTFKGFQNLRLYVTGQNLFTLTNYSGFNPDVNVSSGSTIFNGIDLGAYPLAKTYLIGVSASF